ncbi:TRAP transporter small permease subunit [Lacisediminimonas sp.]|uniref:TRAP transporter small permease subunit n=1 Tax=Lacisediminimonas sp. TaxID=3060582 RepID=UPI00271B8A3F|nr:TRAP transporter small permease subunit [Lacisediminimonas sp.]MDO8298216.1 TRAP transporter small permease subunit [Lacisediminimonas sp.]
MAKRGLTRSAESIESIIDFVGKATSWLSLAIIILMTVNVILRYTLSYGTVWAQELEWHLMAALILFGMSYAMLRGENVRVDLFYAHYSPPMRLAVDILSCLLTMAVAITFIWLSLSYVSQAYGINEVSSDPGGLPMRWAVKALLPIGYGFLLLQSIGALFRLLASYPAAAEPKTPGSA